MRPTYTLKYSILGFLVGGILTHAWAYAEVFVYPRRAGQSMVRNFDFAWRTVDITPELQDVQEDIPGELLQNPSLDVPFILSKSALSKSASRPSVGKVHLFFYEQERKVAQRAAKLIEASYRYLAQRFHYVPRATFPYVLYGSYQEFLQTNLFPLQEGVLGVTSPLDLTMTLPYFGDDRLFTEVSTHELAHQFTIQKIRTLARSYHSRGDPISAMPLWFLEGLAEYYAHKGINPETDMLVRDRMIYPEDGMPAPSFFQNGILEGYVETYKMGQMRCAFLEHAYGSGTLQKILLKSAFLVASHQAPEHFHRFEELVASVTGDTVDLIERKFDAWLRQRVYGTYVHASQDDTWVQTISGWRGRMEAMSSASDGHLLLYRSMDETTGQQRLVLTDTRSPKQDQVVAEDGRPGLESLHPVSDRNFAVRSDALVFFATANGRDRMYWQEITHHAQPAQDSSIFQTPSVFQSPLQDKNFYGTPSSFWKVHLRLGPKRTFLLSEHGLVAAFSPAFSPDGKRVAFVGLDTHGGRNVYILDPDSGSKSTFKLTQVTDDPYAKRDVAWGRQGIVFSSNATADGMFNLFTAQPQAKGPITRLTKEARDHRSPLVRDDGRVFYVAYEPYGQGNLYEVVSSATSNKPALIRRTDLALALGDPCVGPQGGLWVLLQRQGARRPALLPYEHLQNAPVASLPASDSDVAYSMEMQPLDHATAYRPLSLKNWHPGSVFGFLGASNAGVFGQILASAHDQLSNHAVILSIYAYGSLQLTDGYVLYVNQEHRTTWATGPFQRLQYRRDTSLSPSVSFFERFYGGMASVRYPFNRFMFVQADAHVGGVEYFAEDGARLFMSSEPRSALEPTLPDHWQRLYGRRRLQTALSLAWGYDTVSYHPATGPFRGHSWLLELSGYHQPGARQTFGTGRLDGAYYVPIYGSANIYARAGLGTSVGGRLAQQFYLSSFDTLRGVPLGDMRLWGRHYLFSTLELQFPLSSLIEVVLLSNIEGVVGLDAGGVGDSLGQAWRQRVLDGVLGINLGLGPWVLRIHFAKPFNIGAPLPTAAGRWNTNVSLGWLYL